jgi:hypothetical protein
MSSTREAASDWLRELEVARRLRRFYPANHPSLEPALERVTEAEAFVTRSELVLEVRKSSFVLDEQRLTGVRHPARQLACELFRAGVVGLIVRPPLEPSERAAAVALLGRLKERLSHRDREDLLAEADRLESIELVPFVRALGDAPTSREGLNVLAELAASLGSAGVRAGHTGGLIRPSAVAAEVERASDPFGFLQELVDHLGRRLEAYETEGAILRGMALLGAVRDMARAITPDNRMLLARLMLQRSDGGDLRARIPESLVAEDLLTAVEAMLSAGMAIPEATQRAVHALAAPAQRAAGEGGSIPAELTHRARAILSRLSVTPDPASAPADQQGLTNEHGTAEDVRTFHERRIEWPCAIDLVGGGEEISASLDPGPIRRHSAWVLRQVHALVPLSELGRVAARQLVNRYFEHLELGEFAPAIEVAQDLLRQGRDEEVARLSDREGLNALVEALATWGKDHRAEVMMVVALLGERIVPTVVRRLTGEERLAVRRRLLEMIVIVGPPAAAELRAVLHDSRWYVVRNAIYLLRAVAPTQHADAVARLLSHDDQRVVAEAVAYLLDASDPRGLDGLERLLARGSEEAFHEALATAARRRRDDVGRLLAVELKRRLEGPLRSEHLPELVKTVATFTGPEATDALTSLAGLSRWRQRSRLSELWSALLEGLAGRRDPAAIEVLETLAQQKDPSADRARQTVRELTPS